MSCIECKQSCALFQVDDNLAICASCGHHQPLVPVRPTTHPTRDKCVGCGGVLDFFSIPPTAEVSYDEGTCGVCLRCGAVNADVALPVSLHTVATNGYVHRIPRSAACYERLAHINERISQDSCLEPTIQDGHLRVILEELAVQLADGEITPHPSCQRHPSGIYKPHIRQVLSALKKRPEHSHVDWTHVYLEKWKSIRAEHGVPAQLLEPQVRLLLGASMGHLSYLWNTRDQFKGERKNFPNFNVMFRYILDYLVSVGKLDPLAFDTYDWPIPQSAECLKRAAKYAVYLFEKAGVTNYTPLVLNPDHIVC